MTAESDNQDSEGIHHGTLLLTLKPESNTAPVEAIQKDWKVLIEQTLGGILWGKRVEKKQMEKSDALGMIRHSQYGTAVFLLLSDELQMDRDVLMAVACTNPHQLKRVSPDVLSAIDEEFLKTALASGANARILATVSPRIEKIIDGIVPCRTQPQAPAVHRTGSEDVSLRKPRKRFRM